MWYELSCVFVPTNTPCVMTPFDDQEWAQDYIRVMNEDFPGDFSEWVIVIRGKKE